MESEFSDEQIKKLINFRKIEITNCSNCSYQIKSGVRYYCKRLSQSFVICHLDQSTEDYTCPLWKER